jgi:hypothetical protein
MATAIVIIAFAAYVGYLVRFSIALRNWIAVAIVAGGITGFYVSLRISAFDLAKPTAWLYSTIGFGASALTCIIALGAGFLVPSALARAERARTPSKLLALGISALTTSFIVDLWRITAFQVSHWLMSPNLWFAAGVAAFLVVKVRFFEDEPDVDSRKAA